MTGIGMRLVGAAALVALAAAFIGIGATLSTADEPKAVDLTDLRDAVKAAAKRGDNVDEITKALDALDKAVAQGLAPTKGGREAPAELTALRNAVEAAAKKGENVDEIRKQLDAVEMKLIGRVLVAPRPEPPANPVRPDVPQPIRPFPVPPFRGGDLPLPGELFPGGGIDQAAIQKAQEQMRKALESLIQNPNDPDARKIMEEAREAMMKAMLGGRGGFGPAILPELGRMPDLGVGRFPDRVRLGVRMERVAPVTAEQLGIEAGRGIALTEVMPGTPAEKAGFKVHDIVLEFAGKPVTDNPDDFARMVAEAKAGQKLDAVVLRKGKKTEIKGIELPEMPAARPDRLLDDGPGGLKLIPLPPPPIAGVDGGAGNSTSVSIINGNFTIRATMDEVRYTITGQVGANGPEVAKVVIVDGDRTIEATELSKVPAPYLPDVEQLLKSIRVKK